MTERTEVEHQRRDRDDVLSAFASAFTVPKPEMLQEWLQRYPEYEHDLTDLAVALVQTGSVPTGPMPERNDKKRSSNEDSVDLDDLDIYGRMVVQTLLRQPSTSDVWKADPYDVLLFSTQQSGANRRLFPPGSGETILNIQEVADLSLLTTNMVTLLFHYHIRYDSIPSQAIERLAYAMGRHPSSVRPHLSRRTVRSEQGKLIIPIVMQGLPSAMDALVTEDSLLDFFAAIRSDQSMSSDRKAVWLALE